MTFLLWYSTPGYSCFFCSCDRILVDAYGGFLVSLFCFFACGAGALSERAVLSLDTPFPERRTVFLFPRLLNLDILCYVGILRLGGGNWDMMNANAKSHAVLSCA
jgi:hypothetical protein